MKVDYGSLLFNAAGVGIVLLVVGYTGASFVIKEQAGVCSARYPSPFVMNLRTVDGDLYTPMELKGYIGRAQRGVTQNARTMDVETGEFSGAGLRIRMDEGTTTGYEKGDIPGGVGFAWTPGDMNGAQAACLRYRMKLPNDFDFGKGGLLPGLYGGKPLRADQKAVGDKSFASRLVWRTGGQGAAFAQYEGLDHSGYAFASKQLRIPKGNWIDVQQEVVLNTPGKADGLVRVWIDGKLGLEQNGIPWRTSADIGIEGVIAEVTYGIPRLSVMAPALTSIEISEFEVSWQSSRPHQTATKPKSGNIVRF